MNDEKTESYRALYRVRPLMYHVGDIRLWVPIRQDGIVLWFVYLFLFFVLCYLFPILSWVIPLERTVIMVIGPIAAAYYTVKLDPAGKSVPKYLLDMVHFLVRPKWFVRWQAIRHPGGKGKIHFIGICRPYDIFSRKGGGEEWCGGLGVLHGKIESLQSLLLPKSVRVCSRLGSLAIEPAKGKLRNAVTAPSSLQHQRKKTLTFVTTENVDISIYSEIETGKESWKVEQNTAYPLMHKRGGENLS